MADNAAMKSDFELVELAQNGDPDAYDQLVLRHQEVIGRQMRRFTKDHSILEELTQTVFVRAYLNLKSFRPKGPFIHWLRLIASRVGYDHWRQNYRQPNFIEFNATVHSAEPGTINAQQEAEQILEFILARLTPEERQLVYMLYKDEMTTAEVAECMGWNIAMTKMRAYRARKKLRKILESEGIRY